jgi:hypothetical protein
LILGIDPGISGALAWLDDSGEIVAVEDMPTVSVKKGRGERNVVCPQVLADLVWQYEKGTRVACVEQVGTRPKEGPVGAFSFGRSMGVVEGVLAGATIRLQYVSPRVWVPAMGIRGGKDESRAIAMRRWPKQSKLFSRKKDDGRSDAALIALYTLQLTRQREASIDNG